MLSHGEFRLVRQQWKYGKYTYLIQNDYHLTAQELINSVNKISAKSEYMANAQRLQTESKKYGGSSQVISLIEKRF